MSWLVRTNCEERICLNLLSPLAQGRELKCLVGFQCDLGLRVAPRAGAGIEIKKMRAMGFHIRRPSRRGGN